MKTQGGFLISRIGNLSGRFFARMLRDNGLDAFNGPQGRILYALWEHGAMAITGIGQMTGLAKTTLTSMLDRMEGQGLVTRAPDPANRRRVIVDLTDKARGYRAAYDRVSDQASDVFYKGFTQGEVQAFEETLRRIICNLEEEQP